MTGEATVPAGPGPDLSPELDVTVVVVAYRVADEVIACLESVYAETLRHSFEVVVIDNYPFDESASRIREAFPEVTVVVNGSNVGFGAAVNQAARLARGRYVLQLNPDTIVLDGAIDRLVDFADRNPAHGLYGGRTLDSTGALDPRSCFGLPSLWSTVCFGVGLSAAFPHSRVFDPETMGGWQRDSVRRVGVVTGCLCLAPIEVWRRLDGYDERYFLYGEDVDLSARAHELGYAPVITPDATIVHLLGRSSSNRTEKFVFVMRGKVTFARDHFGPISRRLAPPLILAGVALRAAMERVRPRSGRDGMWTTLWQRRAEWKDGHPA